MTITADRIQFEEAVQKYADDYGISFGDACSFLASRNSLEAAVGLLGVYFPISVNDPRCKAESASVLNQFGSFLDRRGYVVPKLWENNIQEDYVGDKVRYRDHVTRILKGMSLDWKNGEIDQFEAYWREGYSVAGIADKFQRDPDEVVLLVIHEARTGRIAKRPNGLFGDARR